MQRSIISLCSILLLCCLFIETVQANTKIYIDNQTDVDIQVIDWSVSGDKVSSKAWKKGNKLIAPGQRNSVLSLTRSGKVNWMDPTPRFVEPGKTVVFHTRILLGNTPEDRAVTLLQKLHGEGATTKMWYTIDGVDEPVDWELENKEYSRQLLSPESDIKVVFKAYDDGKQTHVEYVFSKP